MALPLWWPVPFAAAVTVGHLDIDGASGGSTNLGVAFVQGGDGGGGGSNQLVGIQGDWATSWVNLGLIFSWAGPGVQNGQGSTATASQKPSPSRKPDSGPSATYRFRFDGQAAGGSRKEGGHGHTAWRFR